MTDERDTRHDASADGEAARPSGKRSTRRARTTSQTDSGRVATADSRSAGKSSGTSADAATGNPFKRLMQFLKQVIAELRKVIWPNKKQMITYTTVVVVFVIFMTAFIYGMDAAFVKSVDWLFG